MYPQSRHLYRTTTAVPFFGAARFTAFFFATGFTARVVFFLVAATAFLLTAAGFFAFFAAPFFIGTAFVMDLHRNGLSPEWTRGKTALLEHG